MILQSILLKCKIFIDIDTSSMTTCRKCNKTMYWAKTQQGKNMPVVLLPDGGWETHWKDCRFADKFRKKK